MSPSLVSGLILGALLAAAPGAHASGEAERIISNLAELRFDLLGNPQIKSDHVLPVTSTPGKPHRLLIIPVRFSDVGFDRFKGEVWADAKNRDYLDHLLFSAGLERPRAKTLTHYYHHQSRGRYFVTGKVFPVVDVGQPLARYGRPDRKSDGEWRNDVGPEDLVADALKAAYARDPGFPWADYDVWDPMDHDGDDNTDEPDGYIDHFILVYAGKGQSSCHGLYNLQEKFTANAPADLMEKLTAPERTCADRIWPHRFSLSKNGGKGPVVEGFMNARGGVPLKEDLWVYDYNMQPEYTELSTFIHEFGHSLGLPDIYARETNNSTGAWDAMSGTLDPIPQELSAWSRMVLGWLKPCVVLPRAHGGKKVQSVYLKTMSDWTAGAPPVSGVCDAAMVLLPPKFRDLKLGPLGQSQGRQAAYSGQGNDLRNYIRRVFDLTSSSTSTIRLEFDAWFNIEADWDYLYVEASTDGFNFSRLMPVDKSSATDSSSVMPSKKGHDGPGTIPGFTGLSGDLDGDGKVESAAGCDPKKEKKLSEERVGSGEKDPCETPVWVHAAFDLSAYRGQKVHLRWQYFTDGAAVEAAALIDNIRLDAAGFFDDFEAQEFAGWSVEGYSLSGGTHHLAVPHYYLLEYRDPYENYASAYNYDQAFRKEGLVFYKDPKTESFAAMNIRQRPGVLAWYYDGSYLWSENEPSRNGPGKGFLLVVDSHPQEHRYPPVPEKYFKESGGNTYYEFDEAAQENLRRGFLDVMCFQRKPEYYPPDLKPEDRAACLPGVPPMEKLRFSGKNLLYGYNLINEYLPGPDAERYKSATTLYAIKVQKGKLIYRLYDRALRSLHTADAPFSLDAFSPGVNFYRVAGDGLTLSESRDYPPVPTFDDSHPGAYLNPKLPFGGATLPSAGLKFKLARPLTGAAPKQAKVKVYFEWDR